MNRIRTLTLSGVLSGLGVFVGLGPVGWVVSNITGISLISWVGALIGLILGAFITWRMRRDPNHRGRYSEKLQISEPSKDYKPVPPHLRKQVIVYHTSERPDDTRRKGS